MTDNIITSSLTRLVNILQTDPGIFHAQLQSFAKANPKSVQALLTAVQKAVLEVGGTVPPLSSSQTLVVPEIGDFVKDRGIYMGHDAGWDFYSANDFMRDKNKKLMFINFDEARSELTARNGGRKYGNGTEKALRKAMTKGTYQDGDLFIPFLEFVNGQNQHRDHIRDDNLCSLYKTKPTFEKIKEIVESGNGNDLYTLANTQHFIHVSLIPDVCLPNGDVDWYGMDDYYSHVIPFRAFKRQTAVEMAPA